MVSITLSLAHTKESPPLKLGMLIYRPRVFRFFVHSFFILVGSRRIRQEAVGVKEDGEEEEKKTPHTGRDSVSN
jgi:hypothetical protein